MQRRLLIRLICFLLLTVFVLANTSASALELPSLSDMTQKADELSHKLNPESILDFILSGLISNLSSLSKSLGICAAVIITGSVFSAMKTSSGGGNLFEFISLLLISVSVFTPVTLCFDKASEHMEAVCAFMLSFLPTGVILQSASGNTLSSALTATVFPSLITLLEIVSVSLILPLTKSVFAMNTVNVFMSKKPLGTISGLVKNICLWITGLSFTLFSGLVALNSTLQGAADTLVLKGLRFGAARLIPIAGGLVSESMRNVIASISYIKSITGISGIVFIIYTVLPPILLLLATKLLFMCLSALSSCLMQESISKYIDAASSVLNILLALIISLSLAFILMLSVFMKTATSI